MPYLGGGNESIIDTRSAPPEPFKPAEAPASQGGNGASHAQDQRALPRRAARSLQQGEEAAYRHHRLPRRDRPGRRRTVIVLLWTGGSVSEPRSRPGARPLYGGGD